MNKDVKPDLDQTTITLDADSWEKFNEALDAPAEPNEALKAFLAEGEESALPLIERAFVDEDQRLVVRGYMCGTDWEHEIGQNKHGIEIWRSERACAVGKKCTSECGMVEVEVRIVRTVKKADFSGAKS
jgi:hypothetical protein